MKAIERLYIYIDFKGIKAIPFEKKIGLSNGYLGKQLKRSADLGEGILIKIIENCPEINPNWLLTGKGSMLKDEIISERLEQYKFENKLTYYDLGSILGLTPGEMRGMIRRNEVTEEHITLISEKLETPKDWLLTGKGEMPKINREKIEIVSEPTPTYQRENTNEIINLKRENELLRENNQLLKDKIKGLEAEIEGLKNKM